MSETPTSKTHVPLEDSIPQASLESVLCTEELQQRPSRPPDYERENRALVMLGSALADSPTTIFQTLAETILDITQCDSAGLSLLTRDGKTPDVSGKRFYWPAIAGMWSPHVGGGTPRNFGPCGDVLDQNRTLLFKHFERRYPYLLPVIPAAKECLLVPFYVAGEAVGTIWAIMHNDRRKFDAEDDRVMDSLGKFASSAYQARKHIEDLKFQVAEREKAEAELRVLTDGLEEQVRTRTAELQRSQERFRLAQQAARMGTFEWNIQTGENIWTPELETLYGLPAGSFRGTQTAFESLLHSDDRGRVVELVDEAMKTEQPTKGEWRVIWPDGSVHWIAGRWQVFMNKSGEPSRMVGVNVDITERKATENKLREYERAVEGSEEMMIVVDRQYRYLIANRAFLKRHGKTRDQVIGHFVRELANKGAFEVVFKPTLDECFQGKVVEYELKYFYLDLGERDLSISYFPVEGPNGVDRAVCVVRDITDRKRAEQALAGMTRKLIEAEEQARTRIARELHDDINQRLALLAIQLEQLQDDPFESRTHLQELQKEVLELSDDVQTLSHELHSPKLEYLGVAGAIRSWCREFGERQKTEINVKGDVLSVLPFEVGVCLFRVLQEALHNAVKHSQAQQIEVQLAEQSNEVHLIVRDAGSGFDVEAAMRCHGLGLTSMRERVRLVNGTIAIDSKPKCGTTIHVTVPLESEQQSRRAASS